MSPARPPNYRRYWIALYRRNVDEAAAIVRQAMLCWSAPRIYYHLFRPALNLSGTLFDRGVITYADEHFVTHHTLRFLRDVRRQFIPTNTTGTLALATGVGQESHLIGLRMVCDCLRLKNWRIAWARSSDRAIVRDTTLQLRPAAVLISIGRKAGIETAGRLIEELRRQRYDGTIAIGGRAVLLNPTLVEQLGAHVTAPEGMELARKLRERMRLQVAIARSV